MRILDQHKHYPPMAEQELVENALQCVAGVLPDQSPSRLAQGAARSIHKSRQFTASAVCCRLMSSKLRISMGENCGKQDAFRDGVLSGTGRRWGGGSVQTVIVPLFALSEIRSQIRQNCAEIGPSDARLLSGRLRPANISRLSCKSVVCAGAGIMLWAHLDPSPAFPVSRFLERKGSWQGSS